MSYTPGSAFPLEPGQDLTGLTATVMGLGRFSGGVETVRWLCAKGARVTVTDLAGEEKLARSLAEIADLAADVRGFHGTVIERGGLSDDAGGVFQHGIDGLETATPNAMPLDVAIKNADLVCKVFGPGEGQVIDIQVQAFGGEGDPDFVTARKEEIRLPIPVQDLDQAGHFRRRRVMHER